MSANDKNNKSYLLTTIVLVAGTIGIIVAGIIGLSKPDPLFQNHTTTAYNAYPTITAITSVPPASLPDPTITTQGLTDSVLGIQIIQQELIGAGYNVGPSGADGIYGPATRAAWHSCFVKKQCGQDAISLYVPYNDTPSNEYNSPGFGNGYGEISKTTGLPRTNYVQGYTRSNGTVVQSYCRSHR